MYTYIHIHSCGESNYSKILTICTGICACVYVYNYMYMCITICKLTVHLCAHTCDVIGDVERKKDT